MDEGAGRPRRKIDGGRHEAARGAALQHEPPVQRRRGAEQGVRQPVRLPGLLVDGALVDRVLAAQVDQLGNIRPRELADLEPRRFAVFRAG